MMQTLRRLGLDPFMLMLIGTVILAALMPATGYGAFLVGNAAYAAVCLLFFVYGLKLDPGDIGRGLRNWRLQSLVLAMTYLVFPLLGLLIAAGTAGHLPEELVIGFLFLAILPSTVQSSIAFTSLSHGDVGAAICAASLSNIVGVVLTPLLAALLLRSSGGVSSDTTINIAVQILLPFALGQAMRPLLGGWIAKRHMVGLLVDRGSILLIVYSAFSAGMVAGVWQRIDLSILGMVLVIEALLLATVLITAMLMAKVSGLQPYEAVVVQFCGSTKSIATGIPIANIVFAGTPVSLIVLPLMLFHQMQLFVCASLAQRYSQRLATPIQSPAGE
jgi:solute carrier family 10 (sodium/bile acid cotransporter), member 7